MTPTLLGISLGIVLRMSQTGAADALFLAPLGGLGADVMALGDAYKTVLDTQFSHYLDAYRQSLIAGNWRAVHKNQMELTDIVERTPADVWRRIVENVQAQSGWALSGGTFATTQNPVTAMPSLLGGESIEGTTVTADDFDQLSEDFSAGMRERNRLMRSSPFPNSDIHFPSSRQWSPHISNTNFEGLPGTKVALEKIREAKSAFLNGNVVDSFFAVMEGSVMVSWGHEQEKLLNLAEKFEIRVQESEQDYFFDRLKKHFDLIDRKLIKVRALSDRFYLHHLRELRAIKEIQKIFKANPGQPTREKIARMLGEVVVSSRFLQSLLFPVLTPLHASFLETA